MARSSNDEPALAGARWAPAMRALGDERLARMVENGSESAFTAIYGRYAPLLQGYCRSLLRDDDEAGDALQNSMLKALQAMRRAGRTGPLRPWLFRIAHNESVTIIRQRTRRPGPLNDDMTAGADDAFRRAAAREQLAALLDDMQNLTEYQRGALVMRELGGLSYDEISTALDTTPLAARQAVFVARRRLSEGPAGPVRLRPVLQGLVAPAPVGFALASALGASAGLGAKALATTAAVVTLGVGSVEIVKHHDPAPPKQAATADEPRTRATERRPAAATAPTAVPSSGRSTASGRRAQSSESAQASATPAPASTATVRFAVASQPESRTRTQTVAAEKPAATPVPTSEPETVASQPEAPAPPTRHRRPRPAASPAPATAAPEHEVAEEPVYERPAERPSPSGGSYTARQESGRNCPPEQEEQPAAEAEPAVTPVQ